MIYSSDVPDVFLQSMKFFKFFSSSSYKYCNKRITTCDDGNVQSHDQAESKLNSTINANSGAHTLTYDQKIKRSIKYK